MSDPAAPAGPEFAAFRERETDAPPLPVVVRAAEPGDAVGIARVFAARNRVDVDEALVGIEAELTAIAAGDERRLCLVAVLDGDVVGYGRARFMGYAEHPEARNAPTGWYLTGIVVSPQHRRRGIGLALTRGRLERLAGLGAAEVWYVANALNRVSIALHAGLGFEEVTRDFEVPGVTFRGGVGALFSAATRASPQSATALTLSGPKEDERR